MGFWVIFVFSGVVGCFACFEVLGFVWRGFDFAGSQVDCLSFACWVIILGVSG